MRHYAVLQAKFIGWRRNIGQSGQYFLRLKLSSALMSLYVS